MILHETWDWSLRRVICEFLVDDMNMVIVDGLLAAPDLVLLMVESFDLEHTVRLTRVFAGASPVIAVTARTDERLATRAIKAGAAGCYALDTPLAALENTLRAVLAARDAPARSEG